MDILHFSRHFDVFVKINDQFKQDLQAIQPELINTAGFDAQFLQQYFSPIILQLHHVKIRSQEITVHHKNVIYSDVIAAYRDILRPKQNLVENVLRMDNSIWVGVWCAEIINHDECVIHRILKNILLFHPIKRKILYFQGFKD